MSVNHLYFDLLLWWVIQCLCPKTDFMATSMGEKSNCLQDKEEILDLLYNLFTLRDLPTQKQS